jgi:hypothetical protein
MREVERMVRESKQGGEASPVSIPFLPGGSE